MKDKSLSIKLGPSNLRVEFTPIENDRKFSIKVLSRFEDGCRCRMLYSEGLALYESLKQCCLNFQGIEQLNKWVKETVKTLRSFARTAQPSDINANLLNTIDRRAGIIPHSHHQQTEGP